MPATLIYYMSESSDSQLMNLGNQAPAARVAFAVSPPDSVACAEDCGCAGGFERRGKGKGSTVRVGFALCETLFLKR